MSELLYYRAWTINQLHERLLPDARMLRGRRYKKLGKKILSKFRRRFFFGREPANYALEVKNTFKAEGR